MYQKSLSTKNIEARVSFMRETENRLKDAMRSRGVTYSRTPKRYREAVGVLGEVSAMITMMESLLRVPARYRIESETEREIFFTHMCFQRLYISQCLSAGTRRS